MISTPAALEALLFASGEPLSKKQLATILAITPEQLAEIITELAEGLGGHGLALIETTDEVELRTAPEASEVVKKLREDELSRDLGKGSLETLAVIAYRAAGADKGSGGVSRGEIDWVRGVNSSASLRTLLMRGLVEGREDERDKRRMRYTLTTEALAHLGISCAADLPRAAELGAEAATLLADKPAPATS